MYIVRPHRGDNNTLPRSIQPRAPLRLYRECNGGMRMPSQGELVIDRAVLDIRVSKWSLI